MNRNALVILALLGACQKAESGAGGAGGMPPMPVEAAAALRDTVIESIEAAGQIEAIQAIELRPEVEGRITEIMFRDGQEVAQGTPLFKLDDAEIKAQVARAEADRDLARQALARTRQLIAQNASSAADLERAEATARSADAQYDLLKIRLDRTVVRSPFAGVSGHRLVSLGDYANTNSRLVSLQTVNPQRAVFRVPERYAARLRRGQLVEFGVAALPGRTFTGEVEFVDPVIELPARTILIKALVPNGQRLLQSGMFIDARLATEIRTDAVVIPEDAVLPLQNATVVWVAAEGKADRREVTLGVRTPGFVEVRSGVQAGELVVVGGAERLFPGAPVAPTVVQRVPVTEPGS
ncbi:MAG TPA: efflux RND transporter periplasmic adaptor subunit [Gemmatimonadales bacterium]